MTHALFGLLQGLLDRVPQGESLLERLTVAYNDNEGVDLDETLQLCLRREMHTLEEQVSNVKAGLLTWLDHLLRVLELQREFETKFLEIQEVMRSVENFVDTTFNVRSRKTFKESIEECSVSQTTSF